MDLLQLAALIAGATQVAKQVGVPKKYLALVAIVLGAGLELLLDGFTVEAAVAGLAIGLSTTGIVGLAKNFRK